MGVGRPDQRTAPREWRSVTDEFAAQVRRVPDRVAVETATAALTYAELSARVDRFAARLATRLAGPEPLIGLSLDRDVDLPAWLLAVLKVGGAYLPIDATMPAARLGPMLTEAAPALIVASRHLAPLLPPTEAPVLIAEDVEAAPPAPAVAIRPDMLAYVIYTSGSTGRPKGVEIEHRSLSHLMRTMAQHPGFGDADKLLALTRISFDLSVPDMFLPFTVGGTLALVDLEIAADPERLMAAFAQHRPDVVQGTPSTYRALLEAGWQGLPDLRLLAGGEAMPPALADRLLPLCAELWNMYGPTEATVWATAYRVHNSVSAVPIGWPSEGVNVEVVDDQLRPVSTGEVGEILIGGVGVARGYRHRPDLTSARFIRRTGDKRAYRTGDLGRFGEDGALFCLGRLDDQIKLRGFRIELGDVEAALAAHPCVAWCAARLWTDPIGEPTLVGYVVPRPGPPPTVAEIKEALAARVPAYMVPDRIMTVPTMPLTPNGKVDRAALPSPFAAPARAEAVDADASVIETLGAIWCELLSVASVSATDNFFDLGGYSLMTVRLIRRIEEAFGVKLALTDLMHWSTLEQMAERIAEHGRDEVSEAPLLLNDGGDRPPIFWLDAGPFMRTMAKALPVDQPALALNLSDADEQALGDGPVTIEAVAARLRDQLVAMHPNGPFHLGGWCRWGIVAFELARQLEQSGRAAGLTVLLDAERPGRSTRPRPGLRRRVVELFRPRPPSDSEPATISQRVEWACQSYRAGDYNGNVLLVRPRSVSGDGGWRSLLGDRLVVSFTDGDHETMVRPAHVGEISAAIAHALDDGRAPPLEPLRAEISSVANAHHVEGSDGAARASALAV